MSEKKGVIDGMFLISSLRVDPKVQAALGINGIL